MVPLDETSLSYNSLWFVLVVASGFTAFDLLLSTVKGHRATSLVQELYKGIYSIPPSLSFVLFYFNFFIFLVIRFTSGNCDKFHSMLSLSSLKK